jgi:hypothetical protein
VVVLGAPAEKHNVRGARQVSYNSKPSYWIVVRIDFNAKLTKCRFGDLQSGDIIIEDRNELAMRRRMRHFATVSLALRRAHNRTWKSHAE